MGNISDKLNYLNETKQEIKKALISKDVPISDDDTFRSFANKISQISQGIDTSDATIEAKDVLEGKVAYARNQRIVGTLTLESDYNVKIEIYKGSSIGQSITEILSLPMSSTMTSMASAFSGCQFLKTLPLIDAVKIKNITSAFQYCYELENFEGLKNIGKAFTNKTANYSQYTFGLSNSSKLTYNSLMSIINNLYDLNITFGNSSYPQQLKLGSTNLSKLTAEEIAIATIKGWTVS